MKKKNTKIAVIIPARYSSTRFQGKPLADIMGKPMIYYVYKRVLRNKNIDEVFVATDDDRIRNVVEQFGGNVIMTSDSHPTGTDRIAEAAQQVDADIIVNVQGDEPLVHPQMIDEAIAPIVKGNIEVVTLMTKIENIADIIDTSTVKIVQDINGFALFLSRSPIPYPQTRQNYSVYKQIGLYAFTKNFLLKFATFDQTPLELNEGIEFLRIIENGHKLGTVETEHRSFSVDTISDLHEARKIMGLMNKDEQW